MKTFLLLTALLATGLATAAQAQTGTTSGSQVQTTTTTGQTTPATTTTAPRAVGQGATIETQIGTGNTSLAEPNRVSSTVQSPQERNILNGADPATQTNTSKGTKMKSSSGKAKRKP